MCFVCLSIELFRDEPSYLIDRVQPGNVLTASHITLLNNFFDACFYREGVRRLKTLWTTGSFHFDDRKRRTSKFDREDLPVPTLVDKRKLPNRIYRSGDSRSFSDSTDQNNFGDWHRSAPGKSQKTLGYRRLGAQSATGLFAQAYSA
jgi:hypothetical protein